MSNHSSPQPAAPDRPDVGLLVPPEVIAAAPAHRARYLERAVDMGLDHLAVGDHVSFHVGRGFDGLVHATTLLVAQSELPVTVAVYLLALRHPVTVARSLSSIHEIAPGRLTLGVGVGGEDRNEIAQCGVDPTTRGRRTDEALQLLRSLASGDRVEFHGEFYDLDAAHVAPAITPRQPLVVGGRSTAALERAGRHGDGWLGIWVSPQRFAEATEQVGAVASAAGRLDPTWHHQMNVWCGIGDDRTQARDAVATTMEALYATPFERFAKYVPTGSPSMVAEQLQVYAAAGCGAFNLIIPDPVPERAVEHAAAVRAELLAGGPRSAQLPVTGSRPS
jgi:alkanesulfonate monooxygenase SsuD/methylene tetrahydromethanopterin reductase-like flavin-dependent oxidoreductase (luciferase family)